MAKKKTEQKPTNYELPATLELWVTPEGQRFIRGLATAMASDNSDLRYLAERVADMYWNQKTLIQAFGLQRPAGRRDTGVKRGYAKAVEVLIVTNEYPLSEAIAEVADGLNKDESVVAKAHRYHGKAELINWVEDQRLGDELPQGWATSVEDLRDFIRKRVPGHE